MQSSFSMTARSARDRIAVPDVPMEAIHSRLRTVKARGRARLAICAALCLAAFGASAVFGAGIVDGVRVWLSGDRGAVAIGSFVMVREPIAADVRDAIGRATFPVVLPVGLPAGTRVTKLFYAPKEHPRFIFLLYANERATFDTSFTLLDSRAIDTGALLAMGQAQSKTFAVVRWIVGGETVVWERRPGLSHEALTRIKSSMIAATPQQGLAATERMLRRISVQSGPPSLADVVERYAPLDPRIVLLGEPHPREIASLVATRKPMLDSRVVYLSNIPSTNGMPDYAKATLTWPRTVVISAAGVRAIDAVFRSAGVHGPCACAILFDGRDIATYRVWKIPLSAPATPIKYAVDAKTLVVRHVGTQG